MHEPRLFQQRAEVDHGADADEKQQREQLIRHTGVKKRADGADGSPLRDGPGQRQIDKDRAEAHRQQETRLHLFGDGQVCGRQGTKKDPCRRKSLRQKSQCSQYAPGRQATRGDEAIRRAAGARPLLPFTLRVL